MVVLKWYIYIIIECNANLKSIWRLPGSFLLLNILVVSVSSRVRAGLLEPANLLSIKPKFPLETPLHPSLQRGPVIEAPEERRFSPLDDGLERAERVLGTEASHLFVELSDIFWSFLSVDDEEEDRVCLTEVDHDTQLEACLRETGNNVRFIEGIPKRDEKGSKRCLVNI